MSGYTKFYFLGGMTFFNCIEVLCTSFTGNMRSFDIGIGKLLILGIDISALKDKHFSVPSDFPGHFCCI